MTTREAFLSKIRAAQPAARPRPDVPLFPSPRGDLRRRFTAALDRDGRNVRRRRALDDVNALIAARFGADAVIASAVPGIDGNARFRPIRRRRRCRMSMWAS